MRKLASLVSTPFLRSCLALAFVPIGVACGASTAVSGTAPSGTPEDGGSIDGPDEGNPNDDGGQASCTPVTAAACDAPAPDPGTAREFRHTLSKVTSAAGGANHRGRDLFLPVGAPQWIIGKFAYGVVDKDIKDEDVDIWLLRDCGPTWEKLGTRATTADAAHETVEGVEDTGGHVYFEIPKEKALGLGRHRVRLVVAGDLTFAEMFIEVVPAGATLFLSDVDGTLTTSETAEFPALLSGALPDAHPDAAAALKALSEKGYRPMYLTARPEWLVQRTREFIAARGFPPGIIHTTTTLTGATNDAAATFKTAELKMLADKGLKPTWVFGNTASDATAYENAAIDPKTQRVFFQFDDTAHGGRRIEAYTALLPEFAALAKAPGACP